MQRLSKLITFGILFIVAIAILLPHTAIRIQAFNTGMNASYVYGQSLFTTGGGGTKANLLSKPSAVDTTSGKVIVTDTGNQRVLIFNSFPSANAQFADVVIGQSNFTSNSSSSSGCGYNFVTSTPLLGSATTDGTKLYVSDSGNNRVFIYNSIPTTSGICPDAVFGQTNTTITTPGTQQNKLNRPTKAISSAGKLMVADYGNNRVLILNTVPNSSGSNADLVLGQTTFFTSTSGTLPGKLSNPKSLASDGRHLVVADTGNNRVLIWNNIPTANGINADVVLGQTDFVSNQVDGNDGVPSQSTVGTPEDVYIDSAGKLYVSNTTDHRILIWNSIPSKNNQSADIVIGQSDFTSGGTNLSETLLSAAGFNTPIGMSQANGYLFTADSGNNRILAFQNIVTPPGVDSDNQILFGKNGLLEIRGTASTNSNYAVQSIQYSINGSSYQNVNIGKGALGIDSSIDFRADYDPTSGSPTPDGGYTLRIKSQNNNSDISNGFLYFQPFVTNSPANNSYSEDMLPTFAFSVNRQRTILRDSLSSYEIMVHVDGGDWTSYLSGIPVDFATVKTQPENMRSKDFTGNTNNGIYETTVYTAVYSNESSSIQIRAKDPSMTSFFEGGMTLSGNVQWKVIATDQGGHFQETPISVVRIGSRDSLQTATIFPIAVLNISGVGDPGLNSCDTTSSQDSYSTKSHAPIFYGIANVGAVVSLDLRDTNCVLSLNCKKTYTTIVNAQSRFGINVPALDVMPNHTYSVWLRASKDDNFIELAPFDLSIN